MDYIIIGCIIVTYPATCVVQEVSAEKFESSPIIFGDFIKVGADSSDRLYEELADMKKMKNVLDEVRTYTHCIRV